MAFEKKTLEQIASKLADDLASSINVGQTDIKRQIDINLRNSYVRGVVQSFAPAFYDNYQYIDYVLKQAFPQTADLEYLKIHGATVGIQYNLKTKASGNVVFTGQAGALVPKGTIIQKAGEILFTTKGDGTIANQSIAITIQRAGSLATATSSAPHLLATGMQIVITGADQTDYNITTTITVISETQFTFAVANNPVTPATGTILVTTTFANILVEANTEGTSGNTGSGTGLELLSPIEGVNSNLTIDYNGIYGAIDDEETEVYRARVLERTSNYGDSFTEIGLVIFIKEFVDGVTDVWVKSSYPTAGKTTIYFMRRGDINYIPNSQQRLDVKNTIINGSPKRKVAGIKPANMQDGSIIVNAPEPIIQNFNFLSLTPNTQLMRQAVTDSLTDFFKTVDFEEDVVADRYKSVIYRTVDANGNSPTSYTLSNPTSDINIATGQIAILGDITFS